MEAQIAYKVFDEIMTRCLYGQRNHFCQGRQIYAARGGLLRRTGRPENYMLIVADPRGQ
ncbi:MAG: hypothetical protein ACLRSW_06950 [Christensenellaceae bacterium]